MANNPNNSHSITMTVAQIEAVKAALATIQNNMPFLVELNAEERSALHPINVEKKIFTENTIHVLMNNPKRLPADFKVDEVQNAMKLYTELEELLYTLSHLKEQIKDTQLLVGEENYLKALEGYREVEKTAKEDSSVIDAVYAILRTSYQNQKSITTERQLVFDSYLGTW